LGEKIFDDPSLSASGRVACATCHAGDHAFADGLVVPMGGSGVDVPGFRNAPSLKYLTQNSAFFFDDEGTPTGGFNRDGPRRLVDGTGAPTVPGGARDGERFGG
jgi:cytochrome c peroxidase